METDVEKVASEIGGGLEDVAERTTSLTHSAIRIANTALTSFKGELLDKALNIAKAIVEYDIELQSQ